MRAVVEFIGCREFKTVTIDWVCLGQICSGYQTQDKGINYHDKEQFSAIPATLAGLDTNKAGCDRDTESMGSLTPLVA